MRLTLQATCTSCGDTRSVVVTGVSAWEARRDAVLLVLLVLVGVLRIIRSTTEPAATAHISALGSEVVLWKISTHPATSSAVHVHSSLGRELVLLTVWRGEIITASAAHLLVHSELVHSAKDTRVAHLTLSLRLVVFKLLLLR